MEGNEDLKELLKDFIKLEEQSQKIYSIFAQQLSNGLGKATNVRAEIKCLITYVQDLPTGKEQGRYLALDFGGNNEEGRYITMHPSRKTNIRVLIFNLKGKADELVDSDIYNVPREILLGSGEGLFDFVAECISKTLQKNDLINESLQLGVTFPFPCMQSGLDKAKLLKWTREFQATDVVGEDVGHLLKTAIANKNLNVEVKAILNDSTSALLACAYRNTDCRISVLLGRTCNACYMEHVDNVGLLPRRYRIKPKVLINTEWGSFGDSGSLEFVRSEYDRRIDAHSLNKGVNLFEKMVAGMYLGDLVRLILYDAIDKNLIFEKANNRTTVMNFLAKTDDCIHTMHICEIDDDDPNDLKFTLEFSKDILKVDNISNEDCHKFKYICEAVCRRSGALIGIGLSVLVNKVVERKIVIGADGYLYKNHSKFASYMTEIMNKLVDKKIQFDIKNVEDGSGRGPALAAALGSVVSTRRSTTSSRRSTLKARG